MGNTFAAANRLAQAEHYRFAESLLQGQKEKKSNTAAIEGSYANMASSIRNEGFLGAATSVACVAMAALLLYTQKPLSQMEMPFQILSKFEVLPTKYLQSRQQTYQKDISLTQSTKQDLSSLEQRNYDRFYEVLRNLMQIATPHRI